MVVNLKMLVSFFTALSIGFTIFAKLTMRKLTAQPDEPVPALFVL
jgi:hypothetical protein